MFLADDQHNGGAASAFEPSMWKTHIWNQFSMELQIWDWGITSNVSQMREISGPLT